MKVFPDVEKGLIPYPRVRTLNSRPVQGAAFMILLILLIFSLMSRNHARQAGDNILGRYKSTMSKAAGLKSEKVKTARRLYPEDLMKRPLATDLTSLPKYFHQSWMNATLPKKFEEWSASCQKAHPDWEWILWTDADNFNLVSRYAPWFMETYEFLRSEIYRADTARNIYMHVFGGVYADLDTECLLPYDSIFEQYNVSTLQQTEQNSQISSQKSNKLREKPSQLKNISKTSQDMSPQSDTTTKAERKAFLGCMGTDDDFEGSVPNAWMASTPGHPFWLLPLQAADTLYRQSSRATPESTTGPNALKVQVKVYNRKFRGGKAGWGKRLDRHYARSGWRNLFAADTTNAQAPQSLVILPPFEIYPYSWARDGRMFRDACDLQQRSFDSQKCKLLLSVEHWGSHSITYWGHSWSPNGHIASRIEDLSKSNAGDKHEESDEGDGNGEDQSDEEADRDDQREGDAVEANRQAEERKEQEERRKQQLNRSPTVF